MIPVSVAMIAKNAEATITESLESLKSFDEVLLYLNNSTDNTKNIAESFSNVTIVEGEFTGFGPTKNSAATAAKHDWILSLDSDEIVPTDLLEEIASLDLSDTNMLGIIKRDNYFYGKKINYSGWGKDYLVRLYNKKVHTFNANNVHEFIPELPQSHSVKLKQSFSHLALTDINQFLDKIKYYSDLGAEGKKSCFVLTPVFKAFFAFFKTYVLQLGFMDGWRGLVIAVSDANGRFYRYVKRYVNCKNG